DRTTYLKGFGPKYCVNYDTTVYIDSKPSSCHENKIIDLSNLEIGYHTIQPVNGRKISFTIQESFFIDSPFSSSAGWDLDSLSFSDAKFDVIGINFVKLPKNNFFSIRNFFDLSTGKKLSMRSSNQLFKILTKNKNHGYRLY
ncbi:MAG TPA: hypothetical protein PKD85_13395, partial [Saprospiraceae bacterium]|nr:hypothetical protein [Saprospiraceae bacterium]